jgi:alpha-L-fucosidase
VRWTRDERHVYAFVADVPDGAGGPIVLNARPGLLDPDTAERLDGQPVKAESGPEGVHVTSGGLDTPLPTAIRCAARSPTADPVVRWAWATSGWTPANPA